VKDDSRTLAGLFKNGKSKIYERFFNGGDHKSPPIKYQSRGGENGQT